MSNTSSTPASQDHPALSRDVTVFLIQFSAALNKTRSYPPGHPVLIAAVEVVVQRLAGLLDNRGVLTIGIAAHQILIDGIATDPAHGVMRDLANRLHHHQLAAIRLAQGIGVDEVEAMLGMLAEESWRQSRPVGLIIQEWDEPPWEHIHLEGLPLEQLTLSDRAGAGDRKAEDVWKGLAAAVIGMEGAAPEGTSDPEAMAAAIRHRADDAGVAQAVFGWLMDAGKAVAGSPEALASEKVETLIAALGPETLDRILQNGTDDTGRKAFAMAAARSLPVGAALEVLRAAEDDKHQLSHSMLRMLRKLAGHSGGFSGPVLPGADAALRDSVRQLLGEWTATEEDDLKYRQFLDLLSKPQGRREPVVTAVGERATPESKRLVQMGLELDIAPPAVLRGIDDFARVAPLAEVIELLGKGGEGPAYEALQARLVQPANLGPILRDEGEAEDQLDLLLDALGLAGLEGLLEALEVSENASRRRWLLKRLESLGGEIGPVLVARLPDKPWFVTRNLLGLLATVGLPPGFSVMPFTDDPNAKVRWEAYKILMGGSAQREEGISKAAWDVDDGIARLALSAALEDCPAELSEALPSLLRTRYRDHDLRAHAIRLLATRLTPASRHWLVGQVEEKGWFGRKRLAKKTPELLACLGVLSQHWPGHPEVAPILQRARESRDQEIRDAVPGGGG